VYRAREEVRAARLQNEVTVGEGALLEYVPDAVIPFAGARFAQRTSIRLAAGAGLFWWEILAPGREARGEIFEYTSVELKTDVLAGERLIAAERVRLEPKERQLTSLARFGPYRTWATFHICRVGLEANSWLALESELREVAAGLPSGNGALWGVSTLPAHGMVVRGVAKQGRGALLGLQALWRAAKKRLYGREPVPPRKVN
jgi:urease accessory protein